jgi:molybdopterin/thiamine biosynthesis adenylyltransferase
MDQFKENLGILTEDELEKIQKMHVLLVGLGGLGGYIANSLVRLGVIKMTLVDFDTFQLTNLNRQLFSSQSNLFQLKTKVLKKALLEINPAIEVSLYSKAIETMNFDQTQNFSMIIDAVDNIQTKCYLEDLAENLGIPLLHGAVGGWYGQFGIIMPKSHMLQELYGIQKYGIEKSMKCPTFAPPILANMMVSEFVKYVVYPNQALINKIMMVDLLNNDYEIIFDKSKSIKEG